MTPDKLAEKIPCGPDPDRHAEAIKEYLDAGFDEIHIGQIGDDQQGFFDFFAKSSPPACDLGPLVPRRGAPPDPPAGGGCLRDHR